MFDGSIVSPKLTEWIGTEMQKEAMVAEERRKARKERALSRKTGDKETASEDSPCTTPFILALFLTFGVGLGAADASSLRPARDPRQFRHGSQWLQLAAGNTLPMKGSRLSMSLQVVLIQIFIHVRNLLGNNAGFSLWFLKLPGTLGNPWITLAFPRTFRYFAHPLACTTVGGVMSSLTSKRTSLAREVQTTPVALAGCLPPADRERLGAWRTQVLKLDDGSSEGPDAIIPYIDPLLRNSPHECAGFLKELHNRSMIGFQSADSCESVLGVFFVPKKSGQLQLIFDTRLLNEEFTEPPTTDLPSDDFTRLEMPASWRLGPDIWMASTSASSLEGRARLIPYLRALPMG